MANKATTAAATTTKAAKKTFDTSFTFGANTSKPSKGGGQRGGKTGNASAPTGRKR